MKKTLFLLPVVAALFFSAATAQETSAVGNADGADSPVMPGLFFTAEQRRILEAVRRGVVRKEDLEIADENLVPVVLLEESLGGIVEQERRIVRKREIKIDAFIRSRSTGKARVWLNGKEIEIGDDNDLLQASGLVITNEDVGRSFLAGSDEFNGSRFEARVGQIINVDGRIDEGLPVVLKRTN